MRFIRRGGRVIPIKDGASGESKRYGEKRDLPKPKKIGTGKGTVAGAAVALAAAAVSKKPFLKAGIIGGLVGAAIGSVSLYKRGKGESMKQLQKRASGYDPKKKK